MSNQEIKVVVYIDPSLLGSPGKLGNLCLARTVSGASNVIFQNKQPNDITEANQFLWRERCKIGADVNMPKNGQPIRSQTTLRVIKPRQSCDWKGPDGKPLDDMPPAKDDRLFSIDPSAFGTKNEPIGYNNNLWGELAGGRDSPIYQDTVQYAEVANRSYSAKNFFQLSWEDSSLSAGIFYDRWTEPRKFQMGGGETVRYVSWGPASWGSPNAWVDYGTRDPGRHDPSQALQASS